MKIKALPKLSYYQITKTETILKLFIRISSLVDGSGLLSVENDNLELKSNDTIKITSDKNRAWKNIGNRDLRILVIKLF